MKKTAAQLVAANITGKAFDGRTGHGGEPVLYCQMQRPTFAGWIEVAYRLGLQHGALAAQKKGGAK